MLLRCRFVGTSGSRSHVRPVCSLPVLPFLKKTCLKVKCRINPSAVAVTEGSRLHVKNMFSPIATTTIFYIPAPGAISVRATLAERGYPNSCLRLLSSAIHRSATSTSTSIRRTVRPQPSSSSEERQHSRFELPNIPRTAKTLPFHIEQARKEYSCDETLRHMCQLVNNTLRTQPELQKLVVSCVPTASVGVTSRPGGRAFTPPRARRCTLWMLSGASFMLTLE